ncbi:hypothetical protein [Nostoc linckia]|uniref:hypothetical protein n=1 Tax=Nostoc linckia TaxID=92942 RepID=UPI0015D4CDC5|nr:hypothetical protein [Nostoc linckia]
MCNNPQAAPEDIDEYERLLAARFSVDPSLSRSPEESISAEMRENRLKELYIKIFGSNS